MSLFEFLMVLVSIIIGLGLAEILTGVARVIRYRKSVQGYWVHSVLVGVVFIAYLQNWWEIWDLRGAAEWTFIGLVIMLSAPASLFLIAHLLFPEPMGGASLREHYHGVMRPVWWLGALTVVASTAFRPIVFGQNVFSISNATSFVLLLGFITLALSRRPTLHAILVPVFLLLVLLDVVQWNFVIGS